MNFSTFIEKIGLKMYQIKSDQFKKITFANINMTNFQYIHAIGKMGCPTYSELAEFLNVSKPAITASVNKLINEGIVEKTQSDEDKRLYYLSLTKKGKEVFHICDDTNEKIEEEVKQRLSKEEWEMLIQLLKKSVY